jgi:uncharacterized phage protein (TIGR02216 family)
MNEPADRLLPFPWDTVLHVGFCLLRLSSRDFWALTPIEFSAMAGGMKPRGASTDRAGLDALMRAFPDGAETPSLGISST